MAPPGLFRPDVVRQTFFVIGSPGSAGPQQKKHHAGLAEITPAHSELVSVRAGPQQKKHHLGWGGVAAKKKTPPRREASPPRPAVSE